MEDEALERAQPLEVGLRDGGARLDLHAQQVAFAAFEDDIHLLAGACPEVEQPGCVTEPAAIFISSITTKVSATAARSAGRRSSPPASIPARCARSPESFRYSFGLRASRLPRFSNQGEAGPAGRGSREPSD